MTGSHIKIKKRGKVCERGSERKKEREHREREKEEGAEIMVAE